MTDKNTPELEKNKQAWDGSDIEYKTVSGAKTCLNNAMMELLLIGESLNGLGWALDYPLRAGELTDLSIEQQEFLGHIVTTLRNTSEKMKDIISESNEYKVSLLERK